MLAQRSLQSRGVALFPVNQHEIAVLLNSETVKGPPDDGTLINRGLVIATGGPAASLAVIEQAKAAGVHVFAGSIDEQVPPVLVSADGVAARSTGARFSGAARFFPNRS